MSIVKILSGLGAAGVTGLGLYFGLSQKKKEDTLRAKIEGYRKIATTAREIISNNSDINVLSLVVMEPDSPNWEKRRSSLYKHKLSRLQNAFPKDAVENSEKFRDYCFEKIQERMDDLKESGNDGLYMYFFDSSTADSKKLFWEPCVPTQYEIKQFSGSA